MLVLGVKLDDYIVLDTGKEVIKVKVFREDNGPTSLIRLAIDAPKEVSITRGNIWEELHPGDTMPAVKKIK